MAGAYKWMALSDINVNDPFFDSLKKDYPGFETWYIQKAKDGHNAFTYYDDKGLGAFMMLKFCEREAIELQGTVLSPNRRMKISTLKLSDSIQGNRLGEGAIGIALWNWLESDDEEIYVTVFDKHKKLIDMLQKFGFALVGYNHNNEGVYLRTKQNIDFSTPYSSFPFISKDQKQFAMLPIASNWHDKLFPYSELRNTKQAFEEFSAANGMTKTYLCFANSCPSYTANMPVLIYRIYDGDKCKTYKSVVTSYGTIVRFETIKQNYVAYKSFAEYKNIVGNKSVFTNAEIEEFYQKKNLYVLELVYDHAFGVGNNVNHFTLKNHGIWSNCYPYSARYSMTDFKAILQLAKQDSGKLIK